MTRRTSFSREDFTKRKKKKREREIEKEETHRDSNTYKTKRHNRLKQTQNDTNVNNT